MTATRAPVVLVVDDEPANVALLRKLLGRHGYSVLEATDGTGGLAAAIEQRPDAVLLDVMMPGLDGFEVCRRLRSRPDTAGLPVLLLTALNRTEEKAAGLEAGANDFLAKPFEEIELIARVRSLLRTKALADRLKDILGRYVSDTVAAQILADPAAVRLGGDRRRVTTMFADLRGYTALVEAHPPEAILALLNRYLGFVSDLILTREGAVDDLLGDGVLAFFGAPVAHDDDPYRAVEAAVAVQAELGKLTVPELPGVRLQSGIAIATGEVVAGNIGSERRMKYTVIGDSVNVAARLQSAAGPGQILVDEATYRSVKDLVIAQNVGTLTLPGRVEWVQTYNILGLSVAGLGSPTISAAGHRRA